MKGFLRGLAVAGSLALPVLTNGCADCSTPPYPPNRHPSTSQPHQGPGQTGEKYFAPDGAGEATPLGP